MRPKHYLNEKAEINSKTTSDTGSVKVGQYIKDPLFRNSLFIILASALGGAFGFIFWVLAAKIYPKEDVGIATALISSLSLVILLSRFGLNQSLVRFFPEVVVVFVKSGGWRGKES